MFLSNKISEKENEGSLSSLTTAGASIWKDSVLSSVSERKILHIDNRNKRHHCNNRIESKHIIKSGEEYILNEQQAIDIVIQMYRVLYVV